MNRPIRSAVAAIVIAGLSLYPMLVGAEEQNWYALGLQAESSGNYSLAIERYKVAADQGLSDAKFALGRLYRDVYGDVEKSLTWFREAANQGNVFAQYELGKLYLESGSTAPADVQRARRWLSLAADRGRLKEAAFALFLLEGKSEEKLKWLRRAAKWGDVEAMLRLAEAHEEGQFGLPVNPAEAQRWLERAGLHQESVH